MISTLETNITKDASGKKLIVTRDFNAPLKDVWKAWTDPTILDNWWAPKPWKAETKSMDFKKGGQWLYAMVGPDGDKTWCKVDFHAIEPEKSFSGVSAFCDENGKANGLAPDMHWFTQFSSKGAGTALLVEITFENETDLQKIVEMGFKEGFTMGLGNLDALLA